MAIEVRILGAGELGVLTDIEVGVFDDPICVPSAQTFLEDPRHRLAVAICDGRVVGFASAVIYVHPDKRQPELWINELGVTAEHRRQGIGTRLLQTILESGRSAQCSEAWVLTERTNAPAMSLYSGSGGVPEQHDQVMFTFTLASERNA
jgi:ribosomal protein S18 acetylase RimI-like enzyme